MKTTMNILNSLSSTEMTNLTQVVKETIADVTNHKPLKSFSAADLWNIQRRRKAATIRRYNFI